jgi:CubicO group peptidase (beta-lactamase class C family)
MIQRGYLCDVSRDDTEMRSFKAKIILIPSSLIFLIITFPVPTLSRSYESPYEWPEADPEDYGFLVSRLESTYSIAEHMPYLRSMLVIRHGILVIERYFNDGTRNAAFHIHSASKSFTSALIGIAFREGLLESMDQKLLDFFPEYTTPDLDPRKKNIKIKHLLTMTAGFNFNDTGDEWVSYASSEDWVKYAIELPLLHSPGEDWHYSTPQTNLLSAILTRVANMSTWDFAEQYLFEPLQISIRYWHQDPQGYYTGGHEMYFVPRDMARLGFLYLNNGSIDEEQIIPSEWVQESLQDYAGGRVDEAMGSSFYWNVGYGYQWWLQKLGDYDTFSARGHGGQFIVCIPELDMIVVTTATGTVFDTYPNQYTEMIQLIRNILQAVDPDYQYSPTTDIEDTSGFGISAIFIGFLFLGIESRRKKGKNGEK